MGTVICNHGFVATFHYLSMSAPARLSSGRCDPPKLFQNEKTDETRGLAGQRAGVSTPVLCSVRTLRNP